MYEYTLLQFLFYLSCRYFCLEYKATQPIFPKTCVRANPQLKLIKENKTINVRDPSEALMYSAQFYYCSPSCTEHPAAFVKYLLEPQSKKKVNFSEFRPVQIVCSAAACGADWPQWNVASRRRVNESLLWAQSLSARHLALLMADSILLAGIRVLSRVRLNLRSCLVISYMTNHQYYLDPHNFISLFHIFEHVLTFQVNFYKYFQHLQCRTLRRGLWSQVHLDMISGSII